LSSGVYAVVSATPIRDEPSKAKVSRGYVAETAANRARAFEDVAVQIAPAALSVRAFDTVVTILRASVFSRRTTTERP
jgi:hypothetical protein